MCQATCDPPEAVCDPPEAEDDSASGSNMAHRSDSGSTSSELSDQTSDQIPDQTSNQIPDKPVKQKLKRTPAQLEALAKGREKLAEKRRLAKEAAAAIESKKDQKEYEEESNLNMGCIIL